MMNHNSHLALTGRRHLLGPPKDHPLWRSHAQAVTVLPLSDSLWMAYFAGRDEHNRSRVWAAEIDPTSLEVRAVHRERPALDIGPPRSFDSMGVGAGTAIDLGDRILLYFAAMGPQPDVPFRFQIGLAESTDGGVTFTRLYDRPVLGAGPENPFGVSTPTVYRTSGGWEMLYTSWQEWRDVDGKPEPLYDVRRAVSRDGLIWEAEDRPLLGLLGEHEGGLARPQVWEAAGGWMMMAAVRGWRDFRPSEGQEYRLILARSADGETWERCDDRLVFDPPLAEADWDGRMQSYPWLVRTPNRDVLFYNGNAFGYDGFGCAQLEAREGPPPANAGGGSASRVSGVG